MARPIPVSDNHELHMTIWVFVVVRNACVACYMPSAAVVEAITGYTHHATSVPGESVI